MTFVFDDDKRFEGLSRDQVLRLIGGKAANLAIMGSELELPVPPSFTVSTAACSRFLADGWPTGLDDELRRHMARLEQAVGRRFGDASDPLLVSVRSGAPVSMPGMMDTILNLGLNDATEAGLAVASGSAAFAHGCRRRFETMFRAIVGVDQVPDDPGDQLRAAIEAVFRSWNSDRARTYRQRERIPDDLCTAVTVQAMVFGNRSPDSATGVLFTRNPATGEPAPYGDVRFNAQGEDVVAGTHDTEPIAVLDQRLPAVASELREYATRLERYHADMCDIEFTIEAGRLWMLQCRIGKRSPRAALRIALDMADDPSLPVDRAEAVRRVADILADPPTEVTQGGGAGPAIAVGLGASPGLASGEIATSPEAAVAAADEGRSVILVRSETSPDDVHGMARSAGVLTATGGLASHAAVVARGWGIPAVVGASGVAVRDSSIAIGGRELPAGAMITIDGGTGEVFEGAVAGRTEVVPEAETLLAWARAAGIAIGARRRADVPAPPDAPASARDGALTTDHLIRALAIKGYATPETLAVAVRAAPEEVTVIVDRLVAEGMAEPSAGQLRLTADGQEVATRLLAADTASWGSERAAAALDAFQALDQRLKSTVTRWQMKEIDGAQAINDHADAAYDAAVLADLGHVHRDVVAWLEPEVERLPRLAAYLERLAAANTAAQQGDQRFVASPRVDSYHSAWFELHEDLIRLAGRTRSQEVDAGRA